MKKVGSRELKNRLGRYLARVAAGEIIIVTDRGKPVARLIPATLKQANHQTQEERLRELEAGGFLRLGTRPFRERKLVKAKGKPASQIISEDRR